MIELTKSGIKCWQRYTYNGKTEMGPNCVYKCPKCLAVSLKQKEKYACNKQITWL